MRMGRGHLLSLYNSTRASRTKAACLHPIRRYREGSKEQHRGVVIEERAASTAEEFKRVSEEKANLDRIVEEKERQGIASQTAEKVRDGAQEAVLGNSKTEESVKEKFKVPLDSGYFHKTGDD